MVKRVSKLYSANEMLEILKKQWLDTKDIQALASVSQDKAREIKKNITKNLEDQNYFLPTGLVPNEKVVEYLNLNIKYLKKISEN